MWDNPPLLNYMAGILTGIALLIFMLAGLRLLLGVACLAEGEVEFVTEVVAGLEVVQDDQKELVRDRHLVRREGRVQDGKEDRTDVNPFKAEGHEEDPQHDDHEDDDLQAVTELVDVLPERHPRLVGRVVRYGCGHHVVRATQIPEAQSLLRGIARSPAGLTVGQVGGERL